MSKLRNAPSRAAAHGLFGDNFGDMFEGFFGPLAHYDEQGVNTPAVDVIENDKAFVIRAELPGFKKDEIHVSVHDGVLAIEAETSSESEQEEEGRIVRRERRYGKFRRAMRLGAQVDEAKVKAKYQDGLLDVEVPKTVDVEPRKVAIGVE